MQADLPHGNVLVLAEKPEGGEKLGRSIAAVGERPVILSGAEKFHIGSGDDESVDLVVTDLDTADPAARGLLDRLLARDLFPSIPQIHLFRDGSMRRALLEKGLEAAYMSLPSPPDLAEFQARVRLGAEVGRLRRELARTSIRDPMTRLFNRRYLLLRLDEELARARRYRTSLSLVFFDIDHLKKINDVFGQTTGDSVIQQVAEVLRAQVRKEDVLGRLTGKTFMVILPGNRYRGAATFANKIRTDTEEIVLQHGEDVFEVHVSAGISTSPDNASVQSADDFLRAVDNALAQAKGRGGNRVHIDEGVLSHERRVVLVVDPDPTLLDLAEDLLTLDDYQVVRTDSARTALETLRFRKPDLLVIDLHMVERAGGQLLIEQIQNLFPSGEFPIIGLSGEPGTNPDRLARLGVDRFITKPFSVSLLRSTARDLLESTRSHPV